MYIFVPPLTLKRGYEPAWDYSEQLRHSSEVLSPIPAAAVSKKTHT